MSSTYRLTSCLYAQCKQNTNHVKILPMLSPTWQQYCSLLVCVINIQSNKLLWSTWQVGDWAATMLVKVLIDTRVTEDITRWWQCCWVGANFLAKGTLGRMWWKLYTMLGRLKKTKNILSQLNTSSKRVNIREEANGTWSTCTPLPHSRVDNINPPHRPPQLDKERQ